MHIFVRVRVALQCLTAVSLHRALWCRWLGMWRPWTMPTLRKPSMHWERRWFTGCPTNTVATPTVLFSKTHLLGIPHLFSTTWASGSGSSKPDLHESRMIEVLQLNPWRTDENVSSTINMAITCLFREWFVYIRLEEPGHGLVAPVGWQNPTSNSSSNNTAFSSQWTLSGTPQPG